ncbi:hypothetical protein [Pseudomonas fluorescens]|nr:hypothetical protein [Pseudomonas fluorescens]
MTYYGFDNRKGELRYYPPVVLTFWSGFETFVRRVSELMIATVRDLPAPVIDYLQERETIVRSDGKITRRTCHRPVLDRYAVLLTYGYRWTPDRGSKFWQGLVAANTLRNYYTHLDVTDPRAITSAEALQFMESILLGIIWPSSKLQRTLMLGVYRVYELWELLHQSAEQFTEQPSFLDWHLRKEYLFHCNFENVNIDNFPNAEECIVPRPKES